MGWEERKGRKYLYHKFKTGSRVESFYLGNIFHAYMFYVVMEERRREPNESKLFSQWLDRIDLSLFCPILVLLQPNTTAY